MSLTAISASLPGLEARAYAVGIDNRPSSFVDNSAYFLDCTVLLLRVNTTIATS